MKHIWVWLALAACSDTTYTVEQLQNPETCKECHREHYEEWSGSMHAYAAEDPVFVAMNRRGQRDTQGALGDFCITCHAPMAVRLGLATGASFDPTTLPPEAKGVTCYFCHNVEQVTDDHNNAIELAMDQTMRGGARDPVDNPAHHSRYDRELMVSRSNQSAICGACHDLVTPAGVHLERSFKEWTESIWSSDDPAGFFPQTCSTCHMKPRDGVIADNPALHVISRDEGVHEHSFQGVDLALTAFPHRTEQEDAIKGDLLPSIAIKGTGRDPEHVPGGVCLDPDSVLRIRIDSFSVGHMFPSGAAQDRRMWLEVRAFDSDGNPVFERGVVPDGVDPEETGDPSLDCTNPSTNKACGGFWDRTYKSDNSPAHFFWDVARYDSRLIRPSIALGSDHSTTVEFQIAPSVRITIDRIEVRLLIRPLPFAMLRDLEASGDLDPSIKSQVKTLEVGVPRIWTKATAGDPPADHTFCNPD